MSKQNNLTDFLTDVANAIRAKKGSTDLINPQNFSAEIAALSGGLEIVDMAETTATIEPNKVYVWGMVESLNITLGTSTNESDFFAFRFRCSKPTMTVVTVNGATWAADTELDAQGKPILDLGSYYQCEIKGGTSALYARLAHYIPFADSNVEAVLLSKGVGDGLGITYKDAAKVKSISTWFKSNADITAFEELKHFKGLTGLESNAFLSCSALRSITLPSSISSISYYAFKSCTALEEVKNFENTSVKILQDEIFRGTSLKSIVLPNTVTNIKRFAFYGCSALQQIAFPESLTTIGDSAFYGCSALQQIAFPESLTSIGSSAFNGCSKVTKITMARTIADVTIGNEAFNFGASNVLAEFNADLSSFISIGNLAFMYFKVWSEVTFANVTTIGYRAFQNTTISKIKLPSVTTLPAFSNYEGLFTSCINLVLVDIGDKCTSIGTKSFGRFVGTGGKDITLIVRAVTPPELAGPIIDTQWVRAKLAVIYVPNDSLTAYQEATNWSQYADILKPLSEYTEK